MFELISKSKSHDTKQYWIISQSEIDKFLIDNTLSTDIQNHPDLRNLQKNISYLQFLLNWSVPGNHGNVGKFSERIKMEHYFACKFET